MDLRPRCNSSWNVKILRFLMFNFSLDLCPCISTFFFHLCLFFYYTGVNFFWCWVLLCAHRVANCTLQVCIVTLTLFIVLILWFRCKLLMESMLCSGFWPTLAVFLQKIPILGWVVQQPYIRSVCSVCWCLAINLILCLLDVCISECHCMRCCNYLFSLWFIF